MKKQIIFLTFAILLLGLVNASVTVSSNFKYGEINSAGNLVETNTNINGVGVIGYVCKNAACSSVISKFFGPKSTSGNSMDIVYPTTLQSSNGYGVYVYKDGYIPYEIKSNWAGTGSVGPYNYYLSKKQSCNAALTNTNVEVSNSGTASLTFRVTSPLSHSGKLTYVPSSISSHYSTTTDVTLEIINQDTGTTIYSNTQQISQEFSENSLVTFSTTLAEGNYTFNAQTTLNNEDKCLAYTASSWTQDYTYKIKAEEVIITDLTCFDYVIENNNQSCSIFVENDLGDIEGNVLVNVFYSDDTPFGSCTTDSLNGGCSVKDLQTDLGNKTVYAIAEKSGLKTDDSKNKTFEYTVLKEEYLIENLKVYSDAGYTNEAYSFFRGEAFYVKFDVTKGGLPIDNIVTKATLVSSPGGREELTEEKNENGTYYYRLNKIPLNHNFFGASQVFTFALDFVNQSGGQKEVSLTIKNNPPEITSKIPDRSIEEDETITIDLSKYANDLEDDDEDLRWEVVSSDLNIRTYIINQILTIEGRDEGDETILLRVYDLNNDSDQQEVKIEVEEDEKSDSKKEYKNYSYTPINYETPSYFVNSSLMYLTPQKKPAKEISMIWAWILFWLIIIILITIVILLFKKR